VNVAGANELKLADREMDQRFGRSNAAILSANPTGCNIAANRSDSSQMSNEVLECWFEPANRRHWFDPSPDFDQCIRQRLSLIYVDAVEGRLDHWKDQPDGALALCILFDQAPRNIFRGSARAFATDPQARSIARRILALGFDRSYPTDDHRVFCYLPFEHSENIEDQLLALQLLRERTDMPVVIWRSSPDLDDFHIEIPSSAECRRRRSLNS
jgi:uncharacterized protein (DUF924 family)